MLADLCDWFTMTVSPLSSEKLGRALSPQGYDYLRPCCPRLPRTCEAAEKMLGLREPPLLNPVSNESSSISPSPTHFTAMGTQKESFPLRT